MTSDARRGGVRAAELEAGPGVIEFGAIMAGLQAFAPWHRPHSATNEPCGFGRSAAAGCGSDPPPAAESAAASPAPGVGASRGPAPPRAARRKAEEEREPKDRTGSGMRCDVMCAHGFVLPVAEVRDGTARPA